MFFGIQTERIAAEGRVSPSHPRNNLGFDPKLLSQAVGERLPAGVAQ
jgi:hypothetical protein